MTDKSEATHLEEKLDAAELHGSSASLENAELAVENAADVKFEKRILRRVDIRLLPILGALYTISLIDRTNISAARISGIDLDLDLAVGSRASIALLVFFIGYVIFEIPSNIFIRKVGAANWLASIAFAWGAVSIGIGFCNHWIVLSVCRALLGVLEAGFFPGCVYLVSSWYRRYEVQKRLAGFFLLASALSAFSNILAYGIIQISNSGLNGWNGWRWIFIVEGALTCALAILARFVIIDFPESQRNKFLSAEEKAFVKARLQLDRGDFESQKVTWKVIGNTLADWKVWSFAYMYMTGAIGVYAFLFFLPLILRNGLGYTQQMSFILSAPPALFSVFVAFGISWLADKTRLRGPYVVAQGIISVIGLCMTGFLTAPTPRYIGTFLGEAGMNGLVVTCLAWQANNVRGDAKRAVATAVQIMASGIGGIYSSLVFRQQDAPNYLPGIIAVMAVSIVCVIVAAITSFVLWRENKQADEGERINEGLATFRYTL